MKKVGVKRVQSRFGIFWRAVLKPSFEPGKEDLRGLTPTQDESSLKEVPYRKSGTENSFTQKG